MEVNKETIKKLLNIFWRMRDDCPYEPGTDDPNEYYQGVEDILNLIFDIEY